jgi:hypothetical protein
VACGGWCRARGRALVVGARVGAAAREMHLAGWQHSVTDNCTPWCVTLEQVGCCSPVTLTLFIGPGQCSIPLLGSDRKHLTVIRRWAAVLAGVWASNEWHWH